MKKIMLSASLIVCIASMHINANTQPWDVLIYIESSYGLSHAAIKNVADLVKARAGSTDDDRICIQWHCLAQDEQLGSEAYRFELQHGALLLKESAYMSYNPVDDLCDAGRWAFSGDAHRHTMLVMWNHGSGILDQTWQDMGAGFNWLPEHDVLMEEGCSLDKHERQEDGHRMERHRQRMRRDEMPRRALMFMKEPKLYMSVAELGRAIKKMSRDMLQGRPFDIVGMDMCMMAMVEVGYELASAVRYIVGSQDCELEYGWDYQAAFQKLGEPADVAATIVQAYEDFYTQHAKRGTYTHAALDLNYINQLKEYIDQLARHMIAIMELSGAEPFKKMRRSLPKFCLIPMYTDLYTLCHELEDAQLLFPAYKDAQQLAQCARATQELVELMVIAHCAGKQRDYARGISIYFPLSHLDSSYGDCIFAQKSAWVDAMKAVIG